MEQQYVYGVCKGPDDRIRYGACYGVCRTEQGAIDTILKEWRCQEIQREYTYEDVLKLTLVSDEFSDDQAFEMCVKRFDVRG